MSNPEPPVVAKQASAQVRSGASRADPGPLPPGATTQEFEIVSVIGQGGFGIVYLARDRALQRLVAVKEYMPAQLAGRGRDGIVLALNPAQADVFERGRRSFINEARMLARFSQRGLVEVLRFWEQNGTAYMAMRYYDGATLADYLRRHPGVATEAWLRTVLGPVIDALAAMHAGGCCHRDVSPDNILILKDGGAVLLDLGAARQVLADEKQAMTVMLKPGFAPIEQYADDPRFQQGPWTDVYALAAVLYYCVTGKAPPASAARVMHDNAMALSAGPYGAFSAGFLRAIDRGLALRPEERPATMAKFRSMLDDAATAAPHGEANSQVGAVGPGPRTGPADRAPLQAAAAEARSQASEVAIASAPPRRAWRGGTVASGIAVVLGLAVLGGWSRSEPVPPIAGPQLIAATAAATPSSTVTLGSAAAIGTGAAASADIPHAPTESSPTAAQGQATPTDSSTPAAITKAPTKAAPGQLVLAVEPWAEVRVNGIARGITPPLKTLTLPAGRHLIELRNPAGSSVRKTVEVRPGGKATISHRF